MEDFFDKIKNRLSVDNILDLMKDGKLKEELRQTLTATVNINEKPKQQTVEPIIIESNKNTTIANIEHNSTQGECYLTDKISKEKPEESSEKTKNTPESKLDTIARSEQEAIGKMKQVFIDIDHRKPPTMELSDLSKEDSIEQSQSKQESKKTIIIVNEIPRVEEKPNEAKKQSVIEKNQEVAESEQAKLVNEVIKAKPKDKDVAIISDINDIKTTNTSQPLPAAFDVLDKFEIFLG